MGDQIPDAKVQDTQEDFENRSQENAEEGSDSQTAWEVNRKRTYDVYQHAEMEAIHDARQFLSGVRSQTQKELSAINNLTLQALNNAVTTVHKINTDAADNVASTRAQVLKHADVAMDGLWTDQLNPVERGAGNALSGQAPVNAMGASTGTLDTIFTNISAQNGQLVTGYVTLAQALAQANVNISQSQAAIMATMAEMVNFLKGGGAKAAA